MAQRHNGSRLDPYSENKLFLIPDIARKQSVVMSSATRTVSMSRRLGGKWELESFNINCLQLALLYPGCIVKLKNKK